MKLLLNLTACFLFLVVSTTLKGQTTDTTFTFELNLLTQQMDTHDVVITEFDEHCRATSKTYLDFSCRFGLYDGWCYQSRFEYVYDSNDSLLSQLALHYLDPQDSTSTDSVSKQVFTRDGQGRVTRYSLYAYTGASIEENQRREYVYSGNDQIKFTRYYNYNGNLIKGEENRYVHQNGLITDRSFLMFNYKGDTLHQMEFTYFRSTQGRLDSIQSVKYDTTAGQFVPAGLDGWIYQPDSSHFFTYAIERDTTRFIRDTLEVVEYRYAQGKKIYERKRQRRSMHAWDISEQNHYFQNGRIDSIVVNNSWDDVNLHFLGRSFRSFTYDDGALVSERATYRFRGSLNYDRTTYMPICKTVLSIEGDDIWTIDGVVAYPNPFENELYVPVEEPISYTLRNLAGQILQKGELSPADYRITVENAPAGMLLLEIGEGQEMLKIVHR
ncbi:T9SS type A sorting domain-containing protein [bacterium SCSIO 12741]|nr:T9SS type A sorting domain-containing protein [bacterium SCSIO 12741]